jgi:hypothetical protein
MKVSCVTSIDSTEPCKGMWRNGLTVQVAEAIDSGFQTGRLNGPASSQPSTQAVVGARRSGSTKPLSFKRHRFPREVILHAVWLYCRFTMSLRDVEELMAERRVEVSYETIRCWTIRFGPLIGRG